ncbi:hypothetical protein ZIOFF_051595 [Zingiber officinale]|uniref:Uncharacterized protein n=1 Tax=Zingiber officinale TaxID=94328 RepID=A0A8J5KN25_ZINOF|nr:hypothetical protein ZIOFF_051595 [Zingiber officinale]
MSQNVAGWSLHKTEGRIKHFHYHGTVADRRDPCREFVNASGVAYNGTHYVLDDTLRCAIGAVRSPSTSSVSLNSDASGSPLDWGYDHVYTIAMLNCTFPATVHANVTTTSFVVLEETPGSMTVTAFSA